MVTPKGMPEGWWEGQDSGGGGGIATLEPLLDVREAEEMARHTA